MVWGSKVLTELHSFLLDHLQDIFLKYFDGGFPVYQLQAVTPVQCPTLTLPCRSHALFKFLSWGHSKLQSSLRKNSIWLSVEILGKRKSSQRFSCRRRFKFCWLFHRHMALHCLISLGLHRLRLLVAKTPLCISLKWPSFYLKTFNCFVFCLFACPSEHQHSSLEMSDLTENFFRRHFVTYTRRKRKKERENVYSFSFLQSLLDLWYSCPWFLCLCFKWILAIDHVMYMQICTDPFPSYLKEN